MTATTDRAAEPILYPHTEGGWPLCYGCFRHRTGTAHAIDPRTGTLALLDGDCYRALAAGETPPLPTGSEVERVWRRLARLHQNREIGDDVIDVALATLAPVWLSPQAGWQRFEVLKHELLQLQAAEDPNTVLDAAYTGPDHDPETYVNHLRGLADDAVNKLTGRA